MSACFTLNGTKGKKERKKKKSLQLHVLCGEVWPLAQGEVSAQTAQTDAQGSGFRGQCEHTNRGSLQLRFYGSGGIRS